MYKLLGAMLGLCLLGTTTADASLLIDNFELPVAPAQDITSGSQTISAPNYFQSRTLTGGPGLAPPLGATVSNGELNVVLGMGDVTSVVWGNPLGAPVTIDNLTLTGFILSSAPGSIQYDVLLGATNIGTGLLQQTGPPSSGLGVLRVAPTEIGNLGDVLTIRLTGLAPLAVFQAEGIEATPEPASIGLLGLAMFGGVCRHRKRRKV